MTVFWYSIERYCNVQAGRQSTYEEIKFIEWAYRKLELEFNSDNDEIIIKWRELKFYIDERYYYNYQSVRLG